jgi:hypothetical protein
MAEYLATQTRQIVVEADSATEARKIAESVFYHRPGFSIQLLKTIRETGLVVERRRS